MDFHSLTPSVRALHNSDPSTTTPQKRLTVLLGAGASRFAGAPSTDDLTQRLAQLPLCGRIFSTLGMNAETRGANFEDILHVLEQVESLGQQEPSRAEAMLRPFLSIHRSGTFPDDPLVLRAERLSAIEAIADAFANLDYDSNWRTLYRLLRPFLDHYNIDVFTLNYDLLADVAVNALAGLSGKKFFNGFGRPIDMRGNEGFRPDQYANPPWDLNITIAHIHGSVAFSYALADRRMAYAETIDIVQAPTDLAARRAWENFHREARADAAFSLDGKSPIISGLHKLEKINVRPYLDYYNRFGAAVSHSPYLLVVGYGAGDEHINYWLKEAALIHRQTLRAVEITDRPNSHHFLSQRLAAYDLNWSTTNEGLYYSGAGAHYLVSTSGLTAEGEIASDAFSRFFAS